MRSFALLAVAMLLAGCASAPTEEAAPAATNESSVFAEDYELSNATIPKEELQNATLGPEHIHDAWGGFEELVLLEETIEAGLCEGPIDAAVYAVISAASFGCARLFLPEGAVVPEGAGVLRVEIDATDALKSGTMQFQFRNKAREEHLEPAADPVASWDIELTSADWDIPHAAATSWVMYVGAQGPAGVFNGAVKARIVATKLAGWQPVLAVAHVDHWKLPQLHDFVAPEVMRLLDAPDVSVTNIDPTRFMGQNMPQRLNLTDIIAPGAKHVTIVVDRTGSDCAPVLQCWLVPLLTVGGYERQRVGELIFEEGERRVYDWTVPEMVPEDSVYAEASTTLVDPRIDACTPDGSCGLAGLASTTVTGRLLVLAWHGDVDLDALQAIADGE